MLLKREEITDSAPDKATLLLLHGLSRIQQPGEATAAEVQLSVLSEVTKEQGQRFAKRLSSCNSHEQEHV